MDLTFRAKNLVGDMMDGARVISKACNLPMIGSVCTHQQPLILVVPLPPLVGLIMVWGPVLSRAPREAFFGSRLYLICQICNGVGHTAL